MYVAGKERSSIFRALNVDLKRHGAVCVAVPIQTTSSNDYFSMFIKHVLIYSAHVQMVTTPWPRPPAARCQRASRHRAFPLTPSRKPSSAPSSSRTNNSRSKNKKSLISYFTPSFCLFISSSLFSLFKVFFLFISFFSLSLVLFFFTVLLSSSLNRCRTGVPTVSGPSAEAHAASNPRKTSHRGSNYSTTFIRTFWDPRNIFYAQLSFKKLLHKIFEEGMFL